MTVVKENTIKREKVHPIKTLTKEQREELYTGKRSQWNHGYPCYPGLSGKRILKKIISDE